MFELDYSIAQTSTHLLFFSTLKKFFMHLQLLFIHSKFNEESHFKHSAVPLSKVPFTQRH